MEWNWARGVVLALMVVLALWGVSHLMNSLAWFWNSPVVMILGLIALWVGAEPKRR